MSKFAFSPGICGYGLKGSDGSSGTQGLSMFFTNLNGESDQVLLRTRIQNNYILWSTSTPLPNGRTYQQGDLFVDSQGKVYYVNLTAVYKYTTTNTNFSLAAYFEYADVDSDNGLQRYSNTIDSYLIDNVYSTTVGDYSLIPDNIYSIQPKNFGRIEYVDVVNNTRNPFTIWIASDTDSNQSIALVKDTIGDNTFRLGNLDSGEKTRNVNLKIDVNKFIVSKDTGNLFTRTTDSGTVLTNYEINANSLMTGVFDYSPSSFKYESDVPTSVRIFWDKQDFLGTTDIATLNNIPANLFFYKKLSSYKESAWYFNDAIGTQDASLQHMIFYNIDISGYLDVSGLVEGNSYGMYMTFHNQGWTRSSITKPILPGVTPYLLMLDPSEGYINLDYTGTVDTPSNTYDTSTHFMIDISTNITSGITISKDKDWINLSTTTPSGNPVPTIVDVSISSTTSPTTEVGTITYHSSATDKILTVTRYGKPTTVTFVMTQTSGTGDITTAEDPLEITGTRTFEINANNLPPNSVINLDISIYSSVQSSGSHNAMFSHNIQFENDVSGLLKSVLHGPNCPAGTKVEKWESLYLYDLKSTSFPIRVNMEISDSVPLTDAGDSMTIKLAYGTSVSSPVTGTFNATYVSGDYVNFVYTDSGKQVGMTVT